MLELLSIPAIIAAAEAAKMAGLPSRFAALLAIAIGTSFGFLVGAPLEGLVLGLASSGTYSGLKAMVK